MKNMNKQEEKFCEKWLTVKVSTAFLEATTLVKIFEKYLRRSIT